MVDCEKNVSLPLNNKHCSQKQIEKAAVEKPTKWRRRYCVVALSFINIGLLISLLTLAILWRSMRWSFLEPHENTICQPCADIGLAGEEMPQTIKGKLSREDKDGTLQCCGKASVMFDWIVEQAVDKRQHDYTGEMYPLVSEMCSKTLPEVPSAQVNGLSELQVAEMHEKIHWDHANGFFKGGIHYKRGKMMVSTPGFYYVFSQIKFKVTPPPKSDEPVQTAELQENSTIWHHIYRHSPNTGDKGILLESAKSKYEYQTPTVGEETNFMGAVFRLEEGDELHVYTSHPESLVQSKEANYFGLYLT